MGTARQIWDWLDEVPDPEIPAVSVVDLGIVRKVTVGEASVDIDVAPTYSGCPATEVIEKNIAAMLEKRGVRGVAVRRVLSPPWTTDWISDSGREKLRRYGIAPPERAANRRELLGRPDVSCPRCASNRTKLVSEFGSTACKSSWQCEDCLEPFEYFKCI